MIITNIAALRLCIDVQAPKSESREALQGVTFLPSGGLFASDGALLVYCPEGHDPFYGESVTYKIGKIPAKAQYVSVDAPATATSHGVALTTLIDSNAPDALSVVISTRSAAPEHLSEIAFNSSLTAKVEKHTGLLRWQIKSNGAMMADWGDCTIILMRAG